MRWAAAGILAAALAAWPSAAAAQTPTIGLLAGASRSEINVSGDESLNVAIHHDQGFVAGVFASWPVAAQAWLRAEVNVTHVRSRVRPPAADTNLRLTYLEMPVLFGVSGQPGRARLRVFFGGYGAYLLSASAKADSAAAPPTQGFGDAIRPFDAGWTFGFGVEWHRVLLDARYSGGIVNISRDRSLGGALVVPDGDSNLRYRNRRFGFVIGVPF